LHTSIIVEVKKNIVIISNQVVTSKTSTKELQSLLLENRKIEDTIEFLNPISPTPTPKNFSINPEIFSDFIAHLKNSTNKNILIYGDYDADGVTSTALLYLSLSKHFKNILPFTPHRERDGYGIKASSVFNFSKQKSFIPDIVLTIDNGISAKKEISLLQEAGIEVMIIDHHLAGGAVPDVKYLLHSTDSSASALAWLVASQFDENSPLEVATIGVISDCMNLVGINRKIVVHGLDLFQNSKNHGIQALLQTSGVMGKTPSVYDISFGLAPRLNATGRLQDPTDALRLLCAPSDILASKYSKKLQELNTDRQVIQADALDSISQQIDLNKKLLFIYKPDLHAGIIGLIAGKLTEKYYKPSVIVTNVDGVCKGSCRSIPELHITNCLEELRHLCIDLGGHAAAAGFSLEEKNIQEFSEKLQHIVESKLVDIMLEPKILVDAKMNLDAVTIENISTVDTLSPFGFGNTEPLFLFEKVEVKSKNVIGKDSTHLKLTLENNLDALIFGASPEDFQIKIGDSISFIAKLSSNTWNNLTKPQLLIKYVINNSN